jgi:hypothetical protein
MIITCLRNLKSSRNSESGFEFKVFEFLFSVDQLAQSAIFGNLLGSNRTSLPKENLFPLTYSTSVQIYKNY